jgi:CubicO group peptidase (beta-lactamase class C family)
VNIDFAELDRLIEDEMRSQNVPGLALGIVQGDRIVYVKGYGKADNTGRAVTPDTPFIIGSNSKSFTAMAIMQSVEQGRVYLDAPARQYLPWLHLGDDSFTDQITVRELLNQTSGITTRSGLLEWGGNPSAATEEAFGHFSRQVVVRDPAAGYEYSNLNYQLLGAIVEQASGRSYADYIKANILAPLGMNHTFVSQDEAMQNGMAVGYRAWFGARVPAMMPYLSYQIPSGFIMSSAEDMSRYLLAYINNGTYGGATVLTQNSVQQMWSRPEGDQSPSYYGFGWMVWPNGSVDHEGLVPNFASVMGIYRGEGIGVVVLSNCQDSNVGSLVGEPLGPTRVAVQVLQKLKGEPMLPAPRWSRKSVYAVLALLCFCLAAVYVVQLLRIPRWRKKLTQGRLNWFVHVLVFLVADLLVGVGGLRYMPDLLNATWRTIVHYNPDIGYSLITICGLALLVAVLKVMVTAAALAGRRRTK